MGFRLTPIFIKPNNQLSATDLLESLGCSNPIALQKVDFYDTNKQYDKMFVGQKGDYTIISNGALAYGAFEAHTPLLNLPQSEITALIWDETTGCFGFSILKKGQIMRQIMVAEDEVVCDYGAPVPEESGINEADIFSPEERENIIEEEGIEIFETLLKIEIVCKTINRLAEKCIGTPLLHIKEQIELTTYQC